MLKKNDKIELYIDAFSSEGSGIGRFEGMAVFVDGAAAGALQRELVHASGTARWRLDHVV